VNRDNPDCLCNRISVDVRIRTESDLAGCVRIAEQVRLLDGYPRYLPTDLGRFIASPEAFAAWVAEEQSGIVGHVALHRSTSDAVLALAGETLNQPRDRLGVIARLLVAPEARRRGVGRLLLETATQECLRRGLWPILDVVTQHSEAIMLYEQAGWIRAGQVAATFSDGNELEEIVFLGPRPDQTTPKSISIRDAVMADMEALQSVFERASLSNENDRGPLLEHPSGSSSRIRESSRDGRESLSRMMTPWSALPPI
jgi:GNAT superfamily N-acetyltransferase